MSYQVLDSKGRAIPGVGHANQSVNVSGSETVTIFTGRGVLLRVLITKDVDNGTFAIQNTAGDEQWTGITDYAGSFNIGEVYENGCKIVTTSFSGGTMRIVSLPL